MRSAPAGLQPGGRFGEWKPEAPRYLVADVDGTLIGASGELTADVRDAVKAAADAGLTVGFATGRARLAVTDLWKQLSMPGPHVFHNGAEVRYRGATADSWPLGRDGLAAVLEVADRYELYVEMYEPDRFWVNVLDERARPHWELLGSDPAGVPDDLDGDTILKATFTLFEHHDQDAVVAALADRGVKPGPAHSPMTPHLRYVNATNPKVDKGQALRRAAELIDVSLPATVAVGDALNDLPMFEVTGTAIAMGQSDDEVLDRAHLIAPGVERHGLATAIRAALTDWSE